MSAGSPDAERVLRLLNNASVLEPDIASVLDISIDRGSRGVAVEGGMKSQTEDPHAPGFRYVRWPISFGFARHTALHTFDRHGWPEWGKVALSYGQTLHIGPFKVYLGRRP